MRAVTRFVLAAAVAVSAVLLVPVTSATASAPSAAAPQSFAQSSALPSTQDVVPIPGQPATYKRFSPSHYTPAGGPKFNDPYGSRASRRALAGSSARLALLTSNSRIARFTASAHAAPPSPWSAFSRIRARVSRDLTVPTATPPSTTRWSHLVLVRSGSQPDYQHRAPHIYIAGNLCKNDGHYTKGINKHRCLTSLEDWPAFFNEVHRQVTTQYTPNRCHCIHQGNG